MEALAALWTVVGNFPFLICIVVTFFVVFYLRRILKVWQPKIESNRWFKTFLPIGVIMFSIALSMILMFVPIFAAIHWILAILRGFVASGVLMLGYGWIKNFIKQRARALMPKGEVDKESQNGV